MNRKAAYFFVTLLLFASCVSAQVTPTHPLPTQLASAKKIFLSNGGDMENSISAQIYDLLYQDIQGLSRYQVVLDPSAADLVVQPHHDRNNNHLLLYLIDPHTHIILWTLAVDTEYGFGTKPRNLDKTIAKLVKDFTELTTPSAGPTPAKP